MTKRCKHTRAVAVSMIDVETYECRKCGARGVRRLGPSNDAEPAVLVEMRAAAAEAVPGIARLSMTTEESAGWAAHFWRDDPKPSGEAGWLTYELSTHVDIDARDRTAWSWDISRPIAEQLAETARVDAAAEDALCLKSQHDSDPGKLAQLMADDGHTAETIRQYTGLLGFVVETDHADGCADGPYRIGRCEMCDTETDFDVGPMAQVADPLAVCACTGDALRSETCEVAP